MTRLGRFAPLIGLGIFLIAVIWRLATPMDPNVSSKLRNKPVPAFVLPPMVTGKPALASVDLATGQPHLVNVFASWCVPCITEVGVLGQLKAHGVAIDGVAVRDRPADVADFLRQNGDPYERIGSDQRSQLQIALGSSGVPESFVVDGRGVIRYQHIGPIEVSEVGLILQKLEQAK
jgi:cytochrome c biogenesis protein CcmG, thiol:disulfide interchange protein DsbE